MAKKFAKTIPTISAQTWTIMIYMAGDNNLSEDMITSIYDLRNGLSNGIANTNVNYIIEFDGSHPTASTHRYHLASTGSSTPTPANQNDIITPTSKLKDDPKKNKATSIAELVQYAYLNHKADKYALIISGHSDAFQGRTLLLDESPSGTSTIQDIRDKLKDVLKGKKLDLLGFDSCVMNTLEVIYEFRGVTNFWVGSQGSIPNYTWNYKGIGYTLANKTSGFNTKDIIQAIVENNRDFNHKYSFSGRAIDVSGFDMIFFKSNVVNKLDLLLFALIIQLFIPLFEMAKQNNDVKDVKNLDFSSFPILRLFILTHWKCQTFMQDQSVDMRDFCECLSDSCDILAKEIKSYLPLSIPSGSAAHFIAELKSIAKLSDNVIKELDKSFSNVATVGADYRFATGISLFCPWTFMGMQMSLHEYEKLDFAKDSSWSEIKTGIMWKIFAFLLSVLTQRPGPVFNFPSFNSKTDFLKILLQNGNMEIAKSEIDEITKAIESIFPDFRTKSIESAFNKAFKQFNANYLFVNLLDASGGTKDNPKRTRGMDDDYAFYFRRFKNIRSNEADLENKRDFNKP